MILSPYRNPPYRTPSRTGQPVSSPPGPSNKRKGPISPRADSSLQPSTPQVDNGAIASGANSPRTKVAERFQELEIQQTPQPSLKDSIRSPRKRPKRNTDSPTHEEDDDAPAWSSSEPSSEPAVYSRGATPSAEIGETPWCSSTATVIPSSPPSLSTYMRVGPKIDDSTVNVEKKHSKRLPSPPPAIPLVSPPSQSTVAVDVQDPASDGSIDQAALTWQDNEITGHDIDVTSPDDDGEGINGIGFKPTPAIAYARIQKRKQQVCEWRAREGREARQKRIERRRGGSSTERRNNSRVKPSVRFEGVG